jgi:hypothetical protein
MRNKYKKKQLQDKNEDCKFTKEIPRRELTNSRKPLNQTISQLNMNKSTDKFHKIMTNNDLNRNNANNRYTNKNATSISFKKEMARSDTFNKIFDDKKFRRYLKNENEEKTEKKDDINYRNIKKLNKFNLNKDTLINKIYNTEKNQLQDTQDTTANNNNNNNNNINNNLIKYNSQRFNTIFNNSENNKKPRIYISLRSNMNCENNIKSPINNINNIINSNNSGSNKINNIIIENDNNNGNKNFLKLNRIDNTKNYGNFNISNRNRNYMNYDGDRYSNRKNKNMNINNNLNTNNNNSLNEKSNSLSIISEKISLLNSYEDNSNSLLKEERERERESTKEKKIFSAKMKIDNYNSEKNTKNYFNIIESEIKEENENIKNDKNKIFKNRRFNSILHQKKNMKKIKEINL